MQREWRHGARQQRPAGLPGVETDSAAGGIALGGMAYEMGDLRNLCHQEQQDREA